MQCCASFVPKIRNKKMCSITIWHASVAQCCLKDIMMRGIAIWYANVVQCCASFVPKIRDKKMCEKRYGTLVLCNAARVLFQKYAIKKMRGIAIWYASVVQCCASFVPKIRDKKMRDIKV